MDFDELCGIVRRGRSKNQLDFAGDPDQDGCKVSGSWIQFQELFERFSVYYSDCCR